MCEERERIPPSFFSHYALFSHFVAMYVILNVLLAAQLRKCSSAFEKK